MLRGSARPNGIATLSMSRGESDLVPFKLSTYLSGWDATAFVVNLHSRLQRSRPPDPGTRPWLALKNEAIASLEKDLNAWLAKPSLSLQVQLFDSIVEFLPSGCSLIHKCFRVICKGYDNTNEIAITNLEPRLSALLAQHVMIVVKSLINSWATSTRFHEQLGLPCAFGCVSNHPVQSDCDHSDSLRHYSTCPILWNIFECATELFGGSFASERIGITASSIDLRLLSIALLTFHNLKFNRHECEYDTDDKFGRIRSMFFFVWCEICCSRVPLISKLGIEGVVLRTKIDI